MPATRPLCLICESVEGKYKCPRCNEYTCSMACSREHRDNHPAVEPAKENKPQMPPSHEGNPVDTALAQQHDPNSMSAIADMPEYHALIERYPMLPQHLSMVAAATDPSAMTGVGVDPKYRGRPGFRPSKPPQVWTKEVGLENGVKVLQECKASPDDISEAMREFATLVHIFKERRDTETSRRQKLEEDAKAIGSLIKEEGTS
ncbi:hypothetical protein F5Y15DRAFT_381528 [Xylariaceae sp. FL0016]|nr:hypothetical protein F5Y15DRAFT_381528 [Xylariaceae sp. FL0016]